MIFLSILKDFVDKKKIYQAERTLVKLKRYNVKDMLALTSDDAQPSLADYDEAYDYNTENVSNR